MAGGFGGYFDFLLLNNSPVKESVVETSSNSPQESNAQEHACGVCGKAFERKGRLTQHRRAHRNIRPFACTECGEAFKRADHLRTHKERFHSARLCKSVCCGRTASCFKNLWDWHVRNPEKCTGKPSSGTSGAREGRRAKLKPPLVSRGLTKRRRASPLDASKRQRRQKSNTTTPRRNVAVNRQCGKHVGNSQRPSLSTRPLRKSPRLNHSGQFTAPEGPDSSAADSSDQLDSMQNCGLLSSRSSSTSQESLFLDLSDDENSEALAITTERGLSGGGADANSTTFTDSLEAVSTTEEMPESRSITLGEDDVARVVHPCAIGGSDCSVVDRSSQLNRQQRNMSFDVSDDDGSDGHVIAMERRLTWSTSEDQADEAMNDVESENGHISFEADAFYGPSEVVGTLEQMLASGSGTLSEYGVAYVVKPCVSKLSVLHENGYFSGQMTAKNILVHRNASVDPDPCGYSARECEDLKTAKDDVLALGQLMLKLLPDDHSGLSPSCVDFINSCLAPASAGELIVHPFLQKVERGRTGFQFYVDLFVLQKSLTDASDSLA